VNTLTIISLIGHGCTGQKKSKYGVEKNPQSRLDTDNTSNNSGRIYFGGPRKSDIVIINTHDL